MVIITLTVEMRTQSHGDNRTNNRDENASIPVQRLGRFAWNRSLTIPIDPIDANELQIPEVIHDMPNLRCLTLIHEGERRHAASVMPPTS